MPYLSNNYRYQPKPKLKSLSEAFLFIGFSALAILVMLLVLGWFSVSTLRAAEDINTQFNYQGGLLEELFVIVESPYIEEVIEGEI